MKIDFLGKTLQAPLIIGSSPSIYNGKSAVALYNAGAGAVVTKTIRENPCKELPSHMRDYQNQSLINCGGWSDHSLRQWCDTEIPYAKDHGAFVIASIGLSPEEVTASAPMLAKAGAECFEVVSYNSAEMPEMVRAVKNAVSVPVIAKLSPNGSNWLEDAVHCVEEGADALTGFDSMGPAALIDIERGESILGSTQGWLSGAAIKPFTVYKLMELRKHVDVPLIGLGGVTRGKDIIEFMMAGADLVGVVTAVIENGIGSVAAMMSEADSWMAEKGYTAYTQITGMACGKMKSNPFTVRIDEGKCNRCGLCVRSCCHNALVMEDTLRYHPEKCIQCGLCADKCKRQAIALGK